MTYKSGDLFKQEGSIYVLLSTPLGFIAIDISDLTCFGVPRKKAEDAVDGLTPTGLRLNLKQSKMIDPEIDLEIEPGIDSVEDED